MRTLYDNLELGGPERIAERWELVKLYYRSGVSEDQIAKILTDGEYFPPSWDYRHKIIILRRDIKRIVKNDEQRFARIQQDGQLALIEYISRQELLYQKAMEDRDYGLARELSKDVAKAYGVPTEEPIRLEGDFLSQMKAAFQVGMQKRLEQSKSLPPAEVVIEQANPA